MILIGNAFDSLVILEYPEPAVPSANSRLLIPESADDAPANRNILKVMFCTGVKSNTTWCFFELARIIWPKRAMQQLTYKALRAMTITIVFYILRIVQITAFSSSLFVAIGIPTGVSC